LRRAFIFSLTVILLFSVLFILVANSQLANSPSGELSLLGTARRLQYAWSDVAEGVTLSEGLSVTRNSNSLSILDSLPATFNVSNSLAGYSQFVSSYYSGIAVNATFSPPLSTLGPPLSIGPYGINYTYPDWSKHVLTVSCPSSNSECDAVQTLSLAVVLSNYSFTCDPAGSSCGNTFKWNPAPPNCAWGTADCVNLSFSVTDDLGRTFYCPNYNASQAQCPYFSYLWSSNNSPKDVIPVTESANCKLTFAVGKGNLLSVSFVDNNNNPCGGVDTNLTMTFNSTAFSVNEGANLTVFNYAANQSVTAPVGN
jgi:hypothetical protein